MSNNNLLDFKVLRSLRSLKQSREKIQALGKHICETQGRVASINEQIAKGVMIQKATNSILIKQSKAWQGDLRPKVNVKPALRLVK